MTKLYHFEELLQRDVSMYLYRLIVSIVVLMVFSCSLFAGNEVNPENVQEKESSAVPSDHHPKNTETQAKVGMTIYEQHCIICHRDGIAGAPKMQDAKDWKSRLANKTIDDLVVSAIKGLNAMPARGTCPECSEVDMKAAIQYMLPEHE